MSVDLTERAADRLSSPRAVSIDALDVLGLQEPFTGAQLRHAWLRYAAAHPLIGGDTAAWNRGRQAYQELRLRAARRWRAER